MRTPDRAFALALELRSALDRAHDLAAHLAEDCDVNPDHIRELALVHAHAGDLARKLHHGLARRIDGDSVDVDHVADAARDLVGSLDHDLHRNLYLDFDRAGARDLARPRSRDLLRACFDARDLVSSLENTSNGTALGAPRADKAAAQRPARQVAAPAKGLVAAAARLLPAADRTRYREEYRSELWDLAAIGAGRSKQVGYAARQLLGALPLRYAVQAARPRRAPQ
jgi:hypothetical protein